MKKIKKIRMIEFIDTLSKSDKIILDKEKDIIVVDYCIYEEDTETETETEPEPELTTDTTDTTDTADTADNENDSGRASSDTGDTSDPDRDPYEPRKKKSRIDNDYTPQPTGPVKDKDDYYNMGVYAVSAAAAAVANNAAKYLIDDSGSNSTDTTDTVDTVDTADSTDDGDGDGRELDNEIDVSIRNIIKHIIYDKNKDD